MKTDAELKQDVMAELSWGQAAQGVAWSAPGVRVVINELAIE